MQKKIKFILFLTFFLIIIINVDLVSQIPQQSFRIFPSTVTQSEPIVTVSRTSPNLFFGSAVTFNTATAFRSEGVYVSTNFGVSWFGSDTCNGPLIVNHGGDPGVAITQNNRLVLTHMGLVFLGQYSHFSDDSGKTWSSAYTISNHQVEDKGSTFMDDEPNSPFRGRIYTSYVSFQSSPYRVWFSYSSDNATTWGAPVTINTNPLARSSGPAIAVNKNGKLFITWAGMTSTPPIREDFISIAYSTNGGSNWFLSENIFDVNGVTGTLLGKGNIRINGLPRIAIDNSNSQFSGRIYIVTNEINNSPAGSDHDIILRYSDNDGITWSNGIRVNQDALNNGKIQYLPAVTIDQNGGVNIIFYDDRNTSSDSAEVFLARSTDGGNTWLEFPISDHRFKPKSVIGGPSNYQGDFITLISSSNRLYAYWMDDFSGIYQIWSKIIDLNSLSVEESQFNNLDNFKLYQNYPNPFNPGTTISWQSAVGSWQTIKLYDILGREIETIVEGYYEAGKHSTFYIINSTLPSGVYFYQLRIGDFVETKKMILLR